MSQDDITQILDDGIAAAKRGDRATGRRLLEQVIETEPANELAWIWLASCVNTLRERQECLERVLEINPDNVRAQQALATLLAQNKKGGSEIRKDAMAQLRGERKERPQRQKKDATPATEKAEGSGDNVWIGVIAVFGALIIAGFLLLTQLPTLLAPAPTPTPTARPLVVQQPTLQPTPMPPLPTLPLPTFDGTNLAPTLPPTFTATATTTPTRTPTPTPTPYPLTEFTVYYVGLAEDASVPTLYRGLGDMTELVAIGDDFREIAIDPSGQFMAFVRDVPTDVDGEAVLRPQLHIAPLSNLSQARQLTQLLGTALANPSWSPDARALVFMSNSSGTEDIWYITAEGTGLYAITENDYSNIQPAWSPLPGSNEIVFVSDMDSRGSPEIYRMIIPEPGTDPISERLTTADKSSYAPVWNPRGTHIAFVSDRNGDPDIFIMEANGSRQTLITPNDNEAEDRVPTFTSDGRYVAFISNRIGDRFAVYLTTYDGRELVALTPHNTQALQIIYLPELIFRLR